MILRTTINSPILSSLAILISTVIALVTGCGPEGFDEDPTSKRIVVKPPARCGEHTYFHEAKSNLTEKIRTEARSRSQQLFEQPKFSSLSGNPNWWAYNFFPMSEEEIDNKVAKIAVYDTFDEYRASWQVSDDPAAPEVDWENESLVVTLIWQKQFVNRLYQGDGEVTLYVGRLAQCGDTGSVTDSAIAHLYIVPDDEVQSVSKKTFEETYRLPEMVESTQCETRRTALFGGGFPSYFRMNDLHHIYYTHAGITRPKLRTSKDGESWSDPTPVDSFGRYSEFGFGDVDVTESGDLLGVFGHPYHPALDTGNVTLFASASTDNGIEWQVLDTHFGPSEKGWDSGYTGGHALVRHADEWRLYYSAQSLKWEERYRRHAGVARRKESGEWERLTVKPILTPGAPGELGSTGVTVMDVIEHNGRWWMWYNATNGGKTNSAAPIQTIGLAVSEDGLAWEKFEDPIVAPDFDRYHFVNGAAVGPTDETGYTLYFTGFDEGFGRTTYKVRCEFPGEETVGRMLSGG